MLTQLPPVQCVSLAKDGGSNVFLRVGAFNPLVDEATKVQGGSFVYIALAGRRVV